MPHSTPCCALLTAPGRGAIAVIAVFGGGAPERIDSLFESASGKRLIDANTTSILYGRWRTTGEDVIVARYADRCEVHSHGGRAAPAAILNSLIETGCAEVSLEEAAQQLFGNMWQTDLALALSQAPTERTAEILLTQLQIAPDVLQRLERQRQSGEPALREAAQAELARSLSLASFGQHLTKPWSVVLCGRPNVGKSSLINALVGFERAIVHSEAGTTRDVVTQLTAVEGWPIELKDTAGLRDSDHAIERQGVELAKAEICSADLVLAVFDNMEISNSNWDWEFVQATRAGLVVVNKIDLLSTTELATLDESILRHNHSRQAMPPIVAVSAVHRSRIQELVKSIANRLVPDVPDQDQLIPVSPAHLARLQSLVD